MNGYQPTCYAFSRHSSDTTIKKPSPSNVISAESLIDKHIIQTCGQRVCVCDYGTKKTDFENIKKLKNDQPLKMDEKLKS